ncbi:hypothetical protein F2Q68_00030372 [Brassica cretica]|uniref:Uncharacterized protein n=1 Tax=Brassica cretica TaxID=69181 RepID=A0A8S9GH39_BRACR|nr:hypothetical protein F2Q68_00030372 [Brassica cretica]
MRSLLLSLRRVTLLSRHHHQQPHAFAPIRTRSIPINPTSSFPYLFRHSSSSSHPNGDDAKVAGPLVEYERRIVAGELLDGDLCQLGTLRELQRLYDELVQSADACRLDRYSASAKPTRSNWFWNKFVSPHSSLSPVKGLYLYGGVGTGKTMLMDLFFHQLPSSWRAQRIHFHNFMLSVHSRLQMHKGLEDPLEVVGLEIADEAILLCLDEFMVNDVADALILNRTSNKNHAC